MLHGLVSPETSSGTCRRRECHAGRNHAHRRSVISAHNRQCHPSHWCTGVGGRVFISRSVKPSMDCGLCALDPCSQYDMTAALFRRLSQLAVVRTCRPVCGAPFRIWGNLRWKSNPVSAPSATVNYELVSPDKGTAHGGGYALSASGVLNSPELRLATGAASVPPPPILRIGSHRRSDDVVSKKKKEGECMFTCSLLLLRSEWNSPPPSL
jgi:hypothetical protein